MVFRALRKHISPASILALVALVFAVTGGAYAASDSGGGSGQGAGRATAFVAKAKKKGAPAGKPGPRGPAGPKGATGPVGAAGAAGAQGPVGSQGPKGETGPEGKGTQGVAGVTGPAGATGKEGPTGKTGATGLEGKAAKTLGSGETERGPWAVSISSTTLEKLGIPPAFATGYAGVTAITFSPALPASVTVDVLEEGKTNTECAKDGAEATAAPGYLCIYAETEHPAGLAGHRLTFSAESSGTPLLIYNPSAAEGIADGTWAVTPPE